MDSALVVLSGGQDSVTTLFLAKQKHDVVHALTIDYGQRHAIEIDAARKTAEMAGVSSHEVLPVGPILQGKSFLTDVTREVEVFENFEAMSHHNAFKEDKLDSSFVPMRNSLFLTIAANRAVVKDCRAIYTGVTAADFAEYGEFSWEWLGGFIDAEGCFTRPRNRNAAQIEISQKDPELLHRLRAWMIKSANIEEDGCICIDKAGCASLFFGTRAIRKFMPQLSPHLHTPHRREQARRAGFDLEEECALSDAYVAGFWEGDGSCYGSLTRQTKTTETVSPSFIFLFFQKDPTVLEKIAAYLERDTKPSPFNVTQANPVWSLTVSDGPYSAKLLNRLRKHFCVLGSFRKITKWRHRIGFDGGGFNPPYPDCTPDFIWKLEKSFNESLRSPFAEPLTIETPLMFLTKAQSVRLAMTLPGCMDALAYSHTSYAGVYPPVVNDHATVLRAQGFLEAGVPDPLIVRAWREGLMPLPTTSNYDAVA